MNRVEGAGISAPYVNGAGSKSVTDTALKTSWVNCWSRTQPGSPAFAFVCNGSADAGFQFT